MSNELIVGLPHPEIDVAMLEYAVWHSPKLEHLEEVYIRLKSDHSQEAKATFHEEEYNFYIHHQDGLEVKPWDVKWRRVFPESALERAAINYLYGLQKRAYEIEQVLAQHDCITASGI